MCCLLCRLLLSVDCYWLLLCLLCLSLLGVRCPLVAVVRLVFVDCCCERCAAFWLPVARRCVLLVSCSSLFVVCGLFGVCAVCWLLLFVGWYCLFGVCWQLLLEFLFCSLSCGACCYCALLFVAGRSRCLLLCVVV